MKLDHFFFGKTPNPNPDDDTVSASAQMQSLVSFGENGEYILNEDYAEELIKELEKKSIDPEELGYITSSGENMIDKYIKVELQTMLPKTNARGGDFDGLIKIQRITPDGVPKELTYVKYDTFKSSPTSGTFSIDPETFKILILGGSTTTEYFDLNGNQVSGVTSENDRAAQIEEIDYQSMIKNYGVPFNFLITLHSFAQDVNFMNDVVDKILKNDETIVLSYVESQTIETTTKVYTGKDDIYKREDVTTSEGEIQQGWWHYYDQKEINNGNIRDYNNHLNIDLTWAESVQTTIYGYLRVTKVDTWLKNSEKKIEHQSTPEMQIGEIIVNSYSAHYEEPGETIENVPEGGKTDIIYQHNVHVDEEITTTAENESLTLVDTDSEIKVDDFVDLIKTYPSVKNNLETAPSNIFNMLQETEDTQTYEKIMRYVIYKLSGINYGVTEDDLEYLLDDYLSMGGLTGATIEEKIWFTLLSLGYSKEAAAGVLANIRHESAGVVPNRLEFSRAKGGGNEIPPGYTDETYTAAVDDGTYTNFVYDYAGYGLAQWTSSGRKEGLYLLAKSQGVSIGDEDLQIRYLLGEMGHSEYADGYASYQLSTYKGYSPEDFKNAATPGEAAVAFCWSFERPGGDGHASVRIRYANEYYEKFKDLDSGGVFINNSEDARVIGTFTSPRTGRTFTIFDQIVIARTYDSRWGDRCNRAAQISVCSGYYNATVNEWISIANSAGDGECPRAVAIWNRGNLTYSNQSTGSTFSTQKIKTQIQSGGYIIIYLKGRNAGHTGVSKYGRDWAGSMHWVAILGYNVIDGKEQMFVSDSGHYNSGWVPIDEFDGLASAVIYVNEK